MGRATRRPVLITDAERSQPEQLRTRQIRYSVMMGLRLVCLLVAATLFALQVPWPWLWLPLCVAGMVLLPWIAVLVANDRPPRAEHRIFARWRGGSGRVEPEPRALAPGPTNPTIIDG